MVYQGRIENGQVVLDHPADLPKVPLYSLNWQSKRR